MLCRLIFNTLLKKQLVQIVEMTEFQNLILFCVSTVCKDKIATSLTNMTLIQLQTLMVLNALDDLIAKYTGFLNPSVSFKNP